MVVSEWFEIILKYIYSLAQSHTVFSAFLSDLWWVRQDTITELCAKVLLSFLNCATILLKGKSSVELPIEITSAHRYCKKLTFRGREKGQQVGPKVWGSHILDFCFTLTSPLSLISLQNQIFEHRLQFSLQWI